MANFRDLQPGRAAGKQQPLLYGHVTSHMTWQKHHARDEAKWTEVS
jgi:hypothetical protein